jgi:hypothetical protein
VVEAPEFGLLPQIADGAGAHALQAERDRVQVRLSIAWWYPGVHEIAVTEEIADNLKNVTPMMLRGYLESTSIK